MTDQNDVSRAANAQSRLIEMGVFSAPHGVRGQIKLRSYTEIPEDICAYGPLQDKQGRTYAISIAGEAGDMLIVSVQGINDRNAADSLKNIKLFLPRSKLPKLRKGEYYHEDLSGIEVFTADDKPFGRILSVHDFGAGTLVNIALAQGGEEYMPFNKQTFPNVDIDAGRAIIDPPFIVKGDQKDESGQDD